MPIILPYVDEFRESELNAVYVDELALLTTGRIYACGTASVLNSVFDGRRLVKSDRYD
jgi:hypothetical protein